MRRAANCALISAARAAKKAVNIQRAIAIAAASATFAGDQRVRIYDNANFSSVNNLATAQASNILVTGAALVNCPVVRFP